MDITLPKSVTTALSLLNQSGYEAYIVGGCIRDAILGRSPDDWDITTNALPEDILRVFADHRTIMTGIRHGTVTVLLEDLPLEITTYRVDGDYTDNRHPDRVQFTGSLLEDLNRRDFSINALAYHPTTGLIDSFAGVHDLSLGIIACIGSPEQRFKEDALRILRALRFASVLDFSIDDDTAAAIRQLAPLLKKVSAERIATELLKLLCGKAVRRVLLDFPEVIGEIVPELCDTFGCPQNNAYHHLTVYEHIVETVAAVPADPMLRLTMLLHDCGKPICHIRDVKGIDHFRGHEAVSLSIARRVTSRLRLDKRTCAAVVDLVAHHDDTLEVNDSFLKRLLFRMGVESAFNLIAVQKADVIGQHPDKRGRLTLLDSIDQHLRQLVRNDACFSLRALCVNGCDLQQIGYRPDRRLGDTLSRLLMEVIDGNCANEKDALLRKAKEWL